MKISAKVKNFYYGMSGFSIGLLALALELSVIGYMASIFMNIFSYAFSSPDLIMNIALKIGNMSFIIAWGGIILSLLSDVIIKYDFSDNNQS
ncbi:MAG TPA: hypothetical protein H9675_04100 [Firmicutes bacterium]|nr:hypothetical protein [Bacillota bacterium]